jgi:hypothetical protein
MCGSNVRLSIEIEIDPSFDARFVEGSMDAFKMAGMLSDKTREFINEQQWVLWSWRLGWDTSEPKEL